MGSTFFDLGLFFFDEKPKKIFGIIDKTETFRHEKGHRYPERPVCHPLAICPNVQVRLDLTNEEGDDHSRFPIIVKTPVGECPAGVFSFASQNLRERTVNC